VALSQVISDLNDTFAIAEVMQKLSKEATAKFEDEMIKEGKEVVSRNKWEKKGNHWYYVDNDGKAVSKQWVGSYCIKADKMMVENEWIFDKDYDAWYG